MIWSTLRRILFTEIKDHGNLFLIIPNYSINNGHSIREHLNQKSAHFSSLTRILAKLRPKLINETILSCTLSVENKFCKFRLYGNDSFYSEDSLFALQHLLLFHRQAFF